MEKAAANREESEERVKRKRRKKDLEEIRRNALDFKRNLRKRVPLQKKSTLIKTLNQFSSQRQGIEDVVNSQDSLLNKTKAASEPEPEHAPLNIRGFFQAGIKGKLTTRYHRPQDKLKEAILNGDALQILQSGDLSNKNPNAVNALVGNNVDAELKSKLAQILGDSPESDTDENESNANLVKTSPILRRVKSNVNRRNLVKFDVGKTSNNEGFHKKSTAAGKNFTKEERCKRRLFEDEKSVNSNENTENIHKQHTNVDSELRSSPTNSSPENVLYFTEHPPQKDVNKKVHGVKKLNPKDPQLIKYYVETCKKIAKQELKNIFSLIRDDPLQKAKASLRITYANTVRAHLQQQSTKNSRSSNSDIMLEPDSAIARTLKKNIESKTKFIMWNRENSPYSSRNNEIDDLESEFSAVLSDKVEKNANRKYTSSAQSERSDREFPISVRAVVDPESAKIKMKMDSIDPNRHELIARYLKDIDTSNHQYYKSRSIFSDQRNLSKETDSFYYQKEKLVTGDGNKKNAKHVPAILRKNRPIDNGTEKCQNLKETITKVPMQDLNGESNLVSERSPICSNVIPNQLMEAPKCKYLFMNAKYNQPSRINATQNRISQRISIPEHHLHASPKSAEGDFILFQNYEFSPIKEQAELFTNAHDHHECLFSKERTQQDPNCMVRMPSFGEIQERTDRLTLHSSQGQSCSQESMNNIHPSQEFYNSKSNYYQQFSNNAVYSNQSCPKCKESYPLKPDFPIIQTETNDYSFHRSQNLNYPLNNHQSIRNQSLQPQELPISCNFLQQQSMCQPMKYIAIEGKRMLQRHPVYSMNDNHSHARKVSMQNQQSSMQNQQPSMQMKPCHSRQMQNQVPSFTISSLHYSDQEDLQTTISANFDYDNVPQITNMNGHAIAYVPSSITDQNFIPKQSIPMHVSVNNPRYMGQRMIPSSSYSQVEYQHNHCNNQDFKVNDIYLQQMNRNIHLKRP